MQCQGDGGGAREMGVGPGIGSGCSEVKYEILMFLNNEIRLFFFLYPMFRRLADPDSLLYSISTDPHTVSFGYKERETFHYFLIM